VRVIESTMEKDRSDVAVMKRIIDALFSSLKNYIPYLWFMAE